MYMTVKGCGWGLALSRNVCRRNLLALLIVCLAILVAVAEISYVVRSRTLHVGPVYSSTTASTTTTETSSSTTSTTASVPSRLHTDGRWVRDPSGAIVRLEGAAVFWRFMYASSYYAYNPLAYTDEINETSMDTFKATGANFIRLTVNGWTWYVKQAPNYIAAVDTVVSWAQARGMMVVLDNHGWYDVDTSSDYFSSKVEEITQLTDWDNFMVALAQRYKNEPTVIGFDMLNEPPAASASDWAGYTSQQAWGNWTTNVLTVARAIHAVDPNYLCFVEPLGSSASNDDMAYFQTNPLQEPNIVYSAHEYMGWDYPYAQYAIDYANGNFVSAKEEMAATYYERFIDMLDSNLPVINMEIGVYRSTSMNTPDSDPNWNVWMSDLLTLYDSYGVSFSWFPFDPDRSSSSLISLLSSDQVTLTSGPGAIWSSHTTLLATAPPTTTSNTLGRTAVGSNTSYPTISFGETTYAVNGNLSANIVFVTRWQMPTAGTIESIWTQGAVSGNVRVGIYRDSSGSLGSLIAGPTSGEACTAYSVCIHTLKPIFEPAGYYWLGFDQAAIGNVNRSGHETGTSKYKTHTYSNNNWPTAQDGGWTSSDYATDIYASYVQIEGYTQGTRVQFTGATGALVQRFYFYTAVGSSSDHFTLAFYDDNNGRPNHRLWYSPSEGSASATWNVVAESAGTTDNSWDGTLTSGDYYWYMFQWDNPDNGPSFAPEATGILAAQTYSSLNSTWVGGTLKMNNWSIYLTFIPATTTSDTTTSTTTTPSSTTAFLPVHSQSRRYLLQSHQRNDGTA
jgi:endoglucanase